MHLYCILIEKRGVYRKDDNSISTVSDHTIKKRSPFQWRLQRHNNLLRNDKTVETLVVVDKKMYHQHGDQNITTYTLTLFNMVKCVQNILFLQLSPFRSAENVLYPTIATGQT